MKYTYEKSEIRMAMPSGRIESFPAWEILDPQGDNLAMVYSEAEAEILVSHLNK